ncbi:MAG TPA: hypothetical protein PKY82_22610 [Pyrinomonadaceae bacterium]|nr:hypothetical protein [Pyrinomonadaceae bacterium]
MSEPILLIKKDEKNKPEIFGQKIGFLARIFGCWHTRLSRPMTIGKETFCVCIACGARRKFDLEILQMIGDFYYSPMNSLYSEKKAVVRKENLES